MNLSAWRDRCVALSEQRRSSWLVAGLYLILCLPMLARSPQTGDGAEQVMAAVIGGILHPPGFPLQAWLNRLLVSVPGISPVKMLSLLSALGTALALAAIMELLRTLKVQWSARLIAAAAFGLLPSVWYLAVQPEVFGLANGLMACVLWLSVVMVVKPEPKMSQAVCSGVLCALALSQQLVTIVVFPAALLAIIYAARQPCGKRLLLGFVGSAVATALLLYASLRIFPVRGPWPNWGDLSSWRAVWEHAWRVEYGVFSMGAQKTEAMRNALGLFGEEVMRSWHIVLVLIPLGLWSFAQTPARHRGWVLGMIGSAAVLALALLARASLPVSPDESYRTYFEKLFGTAALPLSIMAAWGFQSLGTFAQRLPRGFAICGGVAALLLAGWIGQGRSQANASQWNHLDIQRFAIAQTLLPDAFYFSRSDGEVFFGVAGGPNGVRYPISSGLTPAPWYAMRVIPGIEPRLGISQPLESIFPVMKEIYEKGGVLMGTEPEMMLNAGPNMELRGLTFLVHKNAKEPVTQSTAMSAVQLCGATSVLGELPVPKKPIAEKVHKLFARAYAGAAMYWEQKQKPELAQEAKAIADALTAGREPEKWRKGCEHLVAAATF